MDFLKLFINIARRIGSQGESDQNEKWFDVLDNVNAQEIVLHLSDNEPQQAYFHRLTRRL